MDRRTSVLDTVRNFFGVETQKKAKPRPLEAVGPLPSPWPTQSQALAVPPSAPCSKRCSLESTVSRARASCGPSQEATSSFYNVVHSSLQELNHKITKEFEIVRREDLLRMRQLERQIISSGGIVESWDDTARTSHPVDSFKGRSVEASLDREKAIERMKGSGALGALSSSLETLRLPNTPAKPSQTRSAPGSARQSRSSFAVDLHNQRKQGSIDVFSEEEEDLMIQAQSAPSSPRGASWKPQKPDMAKPNGPDKAPPILNHSELSREMHAMPEHVTGNNMGTFKTGSTADYIGQTEIMSIEIKKQSMTEVSDIDEERLSVVPNAATAGTSGTGKTTGSTGNAECCLEKHAEIGRMSQEVLSADRLPVPSVSFCGADAHRSNCRISELSASSLIVESFSTPSAHRADNGGDSSQQASLTPGISRSLSDRPSEGRKSCRFNVSEEPHFDKKIKVVDQEDDSSSDGSFNDELQDGVFLGHLTSQFAPLTVRNSLETMRFQLLPIWVDSNKSSVRRQPLGRQVPDQLDADDEDSNGSDNLKEHDSENRKGLASLVMQPNTGIRIPWDYCAALFVGYECVMIPLMYIDLEPTVALIVFGWIIRVFWTIDLPLSFMTGYVLKDGTHELRPRYVVRNYLKTWFLIDSILVVADWLEALISSVSFISGARSLKMMKTLRLLRMVRVIRVTRMKRFPELLETWMEAVFKPDVIPLVFSVFKIVSVFAWINHLMACLWVKLGEGNHGEQSWITGHEFVGASKAYIYACAYHWSLQQFAGAAEVWPWNPAERNFAVATGVVTFVAAAGFVSSLTSSMTHFEIVTSQDSRRLAQLKHWLYDCGISNTVAVRVQRNAQHALKEEKKNMPESSIELLPIISEPLRMEIHYDMHMHLLASHAFFRLSNEVSSWMMRHVCHEATNTLNLSRGDMLFCDGEISQEPRMYFVKNGNLQYSHNTGRRELAGEGCWCSEGGVWTFWTHCGSMQATADCSLLVLEVGRFQSISGQFSKQREFGKQYGLLFVRHLNSCNMDELTDLEDDEMDIEWLAARSCPHLVKQSGLMGKIIKRGSRTSLTGTGLARGGSMAFMAMASMDKAIKRGNGERGNGGRSTPQADGSWTMPGERLDASLSSAAEFQSAEFSINGLKKTHFSMKDQVQSQEEIA